MNQIQIPIRRETFATQLSAPEQFVRTAELRDQVAELVDRVTTVHTGSQQVELAHLTAQITQSDPTDVLRELSIERGFSWPTLATMVGVTTAAIRKWRKNGSITPENRKRLAEVLALCQLLNQVSPLVTDVPLWFDTPVVTETTLTPADLYARGHRAELLDIASQRARPTDVLDAAEPEWRNRYAPDSAFKVVVASDGVPSIVPSDGRA